MVKQLDGQHRKVVLLLSILLYVIPDGASYSVSFLRPPLRHNTERCWTGNSQYSRQTFDDDLFPVIGVYYSRRRYVTRVIAPQDKLQVAGMNSKLRFVIEFFSESVDDLSSVGIQAL